MAQKKKSDTTTKTKDIEEVVLVGGKLILLLK
jgi:hypothetical protein